MMASSRLVVYLIGAALAVAGIALGAASQGEEFLQGAADSDLAQRDAAGSLIILTAFLTAGGTVVAAIALAHAPRRPKWRIFLALGAAVWFCLVLFQTDLPNYTAFQETQQATLSQTHLIREAGGSPSVLLPVLALAAGGLATIGWTLRRLVGEPAATDVARLVARHRMHLALVAPFLIMLPVGFIRVLVALPGDEPRTSIALVLLPVAALASLGLLAVLIVRQETLHRWSRATHMAPVARETLRTLHSIQTILLIVIGVTAVASTFLPKLDFEETSLGRSLVLTLRSHGQGAAFLAIPLFGLLRTQRELAPLILEGAPRFTVSGRAAFYGVLGAAGMAGVVTAVLTAQALAPWIAVAVPLAVWAGIMARPATAAPLMLLSAWLLWARGDTIVGGYDGSQFPPLTLTTPPGLLALWRILAVLLLGWTLFRLGKQAAGRLRPSIAVPLSIAFGVGVGLIALIELPLAAWSLPGGGDDTVAVGSLVASQSPAVRAVAHTLSGLAGLGAALALARMVRPEWFGRRPKATPAEAGADATGSVAA